jgi:hypothetical protein
MVHPFIKKASQSRDQRLYFRGERPRRSTVIKVAWINSAKHATTTWGKTMDFEVEGKSLYSGHVCFPKFCFMPRVIKDIFAKKMRLVTTLDSRCGWLEVKPYMVVPSSYYIPLKCLCSQAYLDPCLSYCTIPIDVVIFLLLYYNNLPVYHMCILVLPIHTMKHLHHCK